MKIQPFRSTSEVPTQIMGLPTITENTVHGGQKSARASQCRNSRQTSGHPTVGSSDERRDFRRPQKNRQSAPLMPGLPAWVRSVSELPANVGTSDGRNSRRTSGLPTSTDSEPVRSTGDRTSGLGRDFRLSVVPTYVGTSDVDSHRNLFYVLVKCKSVTHLILFNCLSTLSSSDQLNFHPS